MNLHLGTGGVPANTSNGHIDIYRALRRRIPPSRHNDPMIFGIMRNLYVSPIGLAT
jgi:hypothetical protein